MKVILTQDVAKLGRRYEVVNVPDGRGLNQLIPQGKAVAATAENTKRINAMKASNDASAAASNAVFKQALETLGGQVVEVAAPANDQGHLFQALKPATVVDALSQLQVSLPESAVVLGDPIKNLGEHQVVLKDGVDTAEVTINVVAK